MVVPGGVAEPVYEARYIKNGNMRSLYGSCEGVVANFKNARTDIPIMLPTRLRKSMKLPPSLRDGHSLSHVHDLEKRLGDLHSHKVS